MSGIYIPGMKMPITCCHCPLIGYDPNIEWNDGGRETQGAYVCVITRELIDNTKREEHCPLIPVPDHGRLIDADEFFKALTMDDCVSILEAMHVQSILSDAPTVIPASGGKENE